MAMRAYAIANDMGILFRDHQLLIFPKRAKAERTRALLNIADDGDFDGRVVRVEIELTEKGR